MAVQDRIDWSESALVEFKADVQGGAAVLAGTRMPVDAIVNNFDYGLSAAEIAEQFELPFNSVEEILAYAQGHRVAHRL